MSSFSVHKKTNTEVAAALYRQAVEWARELEPAEVVDLYCGVGGFALHLAAADRRVHGVEISVEAVEAALVPTLMLLADADGNREVTREELCRFRGEAASPQ